MQVLYAGRSDVGVVRNQNEDNLLLDPGLRLFAVCDGVGGRVGGAEASRIAVEQIAAGVARHRKLINDFVEGNGHVVRRDVGYVLEQAISDASGKIRQAAQQNPHLAGMATTAAAVLVAGNHAFVAHVGDSRVYLARHGTLHPLTEDHSLLNDLRRRGRVPDQGSIDQVYHEALTRALGVLDSARVDLLDLELISGDRFVLCTDGVHHVLGDDDMQAIAPRGDVHEVANELIEATLQRGAPDNCTAIVLDVRDDAAADRAERVRRRLEALQGVSMFRYLPFADLMRVAGIAKERQVPVGIDVFHEGEFGESLYIILDGKAAVLKSDVEIATLVAGAHFGEMSLIERAPRTATVRAQTPLDMVIIERDSFFSLLAEEATAVKLLWGLVRMLNARLKNTSDELTSLKVGKPG
ncbi:MAG: cyclic nucleotide-binding domain-containing protein [Myxococcales bacterium]|nr:cyclic nucleotide-binding domain-containing protein [Myxococcales bacterium]